MPFSLMRFLANAVCKSTDSLRNWGSNINNLNWSPFLCFVLCCLTAVVVWICADSVLGDWLLTSACKQIKNWIELLLLLSVLPHYRLYLLANTLKNWVIIITIIVIMITIIRIRCTDQVVWMKETRNTHRTLNKLLIKGPIGWPRSRRKYDIKKCLREIG
jgi:hypothetical protein